MQDSAGLINTEATVMRNRFDYTIGALTVPNFLPVGAEALTRPAQWHDLLMLCHFFIAVLFSPLYN